jgi:hypothetical protein
MWAIAEKVTSPVVGILRELHNDHATLHKDHQELLKTLHKDHREILKVLRRGSRA